MPYKFNPITQKLDYYETGSGGSTAWTDITGKPSTAGDFTNTTLSSGVLTVTHNFGLTNVQSTIVMILDDNGKQVLPDEITPLTNSVAIDLTSFGTLSGTWKYSIMSLE